MATRNSSLARMSQGERIMVRNRQTATTARQSFTIPGIGITLDFGNPIVLLGTGAVGLLLLLFIMGMMGGDDDRTATERLFRIVPAGG